MQLILCYVNVRLTEVLIYITQSWYQNCDSAIATPQPLYSKPGPNYSKLTMSLVNVSLKLSSLNMAYMLIFLLKNVSSFCICKSDSHFVSKNTCELNTVLTRTFNILTTNELVRLLML